MIEFDKILNTNEKVLWEGKPKFLPYFIGAIPIVIIGLIFLYVGGPSNTGIHSTSAGGITIPNILIGLFLAIAYPLYRFLSYKYVYYVITDKRVIFQSGLIGRDFKMVDYNQISNAEVNIGIIDKLFGNGSGSILISTAGTFVQGRYGPVSRPYSMMNIPNPYEVFKFFKEVSFDVKTDMDYPNKLRPDQNLGFNTNYDPNNKPQ